MFKKFLICACLLAFSSAGLAFDDSQIFFKPMGSKMYYSLGSDSFVDRDGYSVGETSYWYGLGSGPLQVVFNDKLDHYKINFSENLATIFFVSPTLQVYDLIKRFNFNFAAETAHDTTGLLTFEQEIFNPFSMILAGQFAKKGKSRIIAGGKVKFRTDEVSVVYIPRMVDKEEPTDYVPLVNGTALLKAKIREFDNVWIDVDGFMKSMNKEHPLSEDFSPLGYNVTVGYWKVWGRYGVIPYYENNDVYRTGYEIGLNADF